jgi:hypothetical protein
MKDRTNRERPAIRPTIEGIGMMYRSLQSLHERVYPQSPMWFAIMAQGPVDDLRDLLDDLEWLMEDMIPRELREEAAKLREAEEAEAFVLEEAA